MGYIININSESKQALAFIEFAKTFDFTEITKVKTKKTALGKPEILDEDEDGIPIKYRKEIMTLSKKVNKGIRKRWEADLAKKGAL